MARRLIAVVAGIVDSMRSFKCSNPALRVFEVHGAYWFARHAFLTGSLRSFRRARASAFRSPTPLRFYAWYAMPTIALLALHCRFHGTLSVFIANQEGQGVLGDAVCRDPWARKYSYSLEVFQKTSGVRAWGC